MKVFFVFIFTALLTQTAFSYQTLLVNQSYLDANIVEYSDYISDPSNSYFISEVRSPAIAMQFSPIHSDTVRYGLLNHTVWLTMGLNNPSGKAQRLFLVIKAPFMETIDFYYEIDEFNDFKRQVTGSSVAFKKRPYQMGNFIIPFEISTGSQQVYLRLSPLEATNTRVRIIDEHTLLASLNHETQFKAMVLTFLMICVVVCLIGYFKFRSNINLWAATLVTGLLLNFTGWSGLSSSWLTALPYADVSINNLGAFISLTGAAGLLTCLRADQFGSWLTDSLLWLSRLLAFLALLSCFPLSSNMLMIQLIVIPVALTIIGIFWFIQRPITLSERLALWGFAALIIYYIMSTLILVGLLSAFNEVMNAMMFALIICSLLITWTGWLSSKYRSARTAVEGFTLPNVHWPLLRKINHEIRGPINGVLGMTELMQDTTLSAHQQEYINTIQAAGFSLLREADQLQNLIRIGLNRLPESEDEFDLYDLIEDTIQPFSRIAHGKHLELVLDVAPEIPTRYRGNAHIISQILSNLLDNAIKFTDHGEVLLQVKPWQNGRVRFSITDTGPGIAKEDRSLLFNFPDKDNVAQQSPKDVHLGLPISKYLVGLLSGQLSLSSELRLGTTFWVDLPLSTVHIHDTVKTQPEEALDKLRLMVVDDNLTCRKVIEHLALSWDMSVLSMSNGQSALANLHNEFHKGNAIDVLVLDQNMPSMSGMELAKRIREDDSLNKDIVIIMMTGADDVMSDIDDQDVGIQFLLSKPVSARALKHTINVAMPKLLKNRDKNNVKSSLFF